jgi:hypothetical protein
VYAPTELELVCAIVQNHASTQLLRQAAVAEQSASGGAVRCVLAKVLIKGLRWHRRQWGERALVVVVAIFLDFNLRWEGFWLLIDVCLLGAKLGAELDVVNIAWLVEECEDASAFDRVVFCANACCDE